MPEGELIGHVSTASVSTGTGPVSTRGTVEIQITVQLPSAKRATAAANALGKFVKNITESQYVRKSLSVYQQHTEQYAARLVAVDNLIAAYNKVLSGPNAAHLDPFEKLILSAQLNDQIARQGNIQDEQRSQQPAGPDPRAGHRGRPDPDARSRRRRSPLAAAATASSSAPSSASSSA